MQNTAYEMRISDWSSDVCSSDLEAHVEHAVGFVEHQHFDRVELGAAAREVVDQAAGGGDEDVDPAAQVVDLRAHAGATEDGGDVQAQGAAGGLDGVGGLRRDPGRDLHSIRLHPSQSGAFRMASSPCKKQNSISKS